MMRKHKIMIVAVILAVSAALFTATAFTTPKGNIWRPGADISTSLSEISEGVNGIDAGVGSMNALGERLDFRLERLETILAEMQVAMDKAVEAMLRLSDDIGEMADRIVETMELLSETLLELVDSRNAALARVTAGVPVGVGGSATLILSPSEGQTLTDVTVFELAGGQDAFILYASGDAGMANPTNILVRDNMLAAALTRIKGYVKDDEVYVAAKAVDGGSVGGISNTVMLYVP